MLLEDIPTNIRGYQPENFSRSYRGMVPADEALIHSLNVTAVLLLKEYGIERFRQDLIGAGISTLRFSAEHYGLPLVLGGAEVKLWDLCSVYASMGRSLAHAYPYNHQYDPADFHPGISDRQHTVIKQKLTDHPTVWDYAAIWHTFNAMRDLNRPDEEGQWEAFQTEKQIAWKTGTSFGFRDAWAVGVSPRFTVGVWIGNADGEGRPGLMGARAAAPVMFDVFRNLPGAEWWAPPYDVMTQIPVCRMSGYIAGPDCQETDSVHIPMKSLAVGKCPYHQRIYTDISGTYQYHADCASLRDVHPVSWFVLPAAAAWLYGRNHPAYKPLPPMHPSCTGKSNDALTELQLIYPASEARIFIPRELNGDKGHTVFRAAHRSASTEVFWYMDREFIGKTREFHTVELQPEPGMHTIILVDAQGERIERTFEVVGR
jgi:penicillin-binding protein 1C